MHPLSPPKSIFRVFFVPALMAYPAPPPVSHLAAVSQSAQPSYTCWPRAPTLFLPAAQNRRQCCTFFFLSVGAPLELATASTFDLISFLDRLLGPEGLSKTTTRGCRPVASPVMLALSCRLRCLRLPSISSPFDPASSTELLGVPQVTKLHRWGAV